MRGSAASGALAATVPRAAMGVPRKLEAAKHPELAFVRAGRLFLIGRLRRARRYERLGAKGLELHDIGAGIGGRVDELKGQPGIPVVIDAGLGDDRDANAHAAAPERSWNVLYLSRLKSAERRTAAIFRAVPPPP